MNEDSFYSIDRLVEFGMGMAMAQQMVRTMNETMQNMYVPGAMNPILSQPSSVFYVIIDNTQVGPLAESDLSQLINEKKVSKDSYVWQPGMSSWQKIEQVPNALRIVAMTPPPIPITEPK